MRLPTLYTYYNSSERKFNHICEDREKRYNRATTMVECALVKNIIGNSSTNFLNFNWLVFLSMHTFEGLKPFPTEIVYKYR